MKAINKIQEEIKKQKELLSIAKHYTIVLDAWDNRNALNEKYGFVSVSNEKRVLFESTSKALFFITTLEFKSSDIKHFLEMYTISFDVTHPYFTEISKLLTSVKIIEMYLKTSDKSKDKFWEVYNLEHMN